MAARHSRAFTLVELVVVIAVAAILLAVAAPSFSDYILSQRVRSIQAQLVTDLQFARSEATSRSRFVGVQFEYRAGAGASNGSCYILFARLQRPDANPRSCDCFGGEGTRCSGAGGYSDIEEIRRVLIPNELKVTVRVPAAIEAAAGTWRPVAYFDPNTGGYLAGNSAPAALTTDGFIVDTKAGDSKALRVVVGAVGRPAQCTPAGSQLGGTPC